MKKTLKVLCTLVLTFVLLLGLTGCGDEKNSNGNVSNNAGGNQQDNSVSDDLVWSDNDFTKQVPKPEQSFAEKALIDSVTCLSYPLWTVEQAKSYAQLLESKGFVLSSKYIDDDDEYMVVYKNADGSYQVTLRATTSESDGNLSIAIPLDRR